MRLIDADHFKNIIETNYDQGPIGSNEISISTLYWLLNKEKEIDPAKVISECCKEHPICDESCRYHCYNNDGDDVCKLDIPCPSCSPDSWKID